MLASLSRIEIVLRQKYPDIDEHTAHYISAKILFLAESVFLGILKPQIEKSDFQDGKVIAEIEDEIEDAIAGFINASGDQWLTSAKKKLGVGPIAR